MRVLIVADVLGEENNGTTIACTNLIKYLQSQGDEVRVLCADQDKKGWLNYFVVPNLYLGFVADIILKKNNVTLARPTTKIVKQALEGVDVCHVMIPFALGIKAMKIARKMHIPVTAGFHCQAENFTAHLKLMNSKLANWITYKTFYKNFYQYVDAIHYPTQFIKDVFEHAINKKTNGYVISNGVNDQYKAMKVRRKEPFKGHFNILSIGRFSREKAHFLLLKAVALSKHKDEIQLVFAGQGPYYNQIKTQSKKLGLIPPIMNFYSRDDLVKAINSCDLYVHPAQVELEGIACLEAITCGLVPVFNNSKRSATSNFALGEMNLFKDNDPQDLANKIDYWIEHKEEKDKCSAAYLGFTNQFGQEECMRRMREMLLTYANNPLCHTDKRKRYYVDEVNDDFASLLVNKKHLKAPFKYVDRNPFYRFLSGLLYYVIAKPIVWLMNKLFNRQKIVNKNILKDYKNQGYFIYANHTNDMGDAYTPNILTSKRNYMIVSEETMSIKGIQTLVKMMGAIPVPYEMGNVRPFLNAIEERIVKDKASITIYPEAHIWPTYTGIRNFKEESFRYPVDLNVPCFVITNTYQKSGCLKKPRLVSYISGPFYPDTTLPRKEAIKKLRDEVYNEMVSKSTSVEQVEQIRYIKIDK